ncbi:hypothetical protein MTO96_007111 [Rhipicephalus appendiculatus]
MRGIIGGFVVGLLTATMTQGDYEFDKTVQDYVNDAMKKLKKFTEDLPTNKSVVIRDFVRASSNELGSNSAMFFSLGSIQGLDSLEISGKCKVNEKTKRYNVQCPVEFSKLQCTLPRVDDIAIYVLSVGANGKIYFRVYKERP